MFTPFCAAWLVGSQGNHIVSLAWIKRSIMRISPEPLSPLRNWRELWHSEPLYYPTDYRERSGSQPGFGKPQKRATFQWLSHLFIRDVHR